MLCSNDQKLVRLVRRIKRISMPRQSTEEVLEVIGVIRFMQLLSPRLLLLRTRIWQVIFLKTPIKYADDYHSCVWLGFQNKN